jgi:hypothetical protein
MMPRRRLSFPLGLVVNSSRAFRWAVDFDFPNSLPNSLKDKPCARLRFMCAVRFDSVVEAEPSLMRSDYISKMILHKDDKKDPQVSLRASSSPRTEESIR